MLLETAGFGLERKQFNLENETFRLEIAEFGLENDEFNLEYNDFKSENPVRQPRNALKRRALRPKPGFLPQPAWKPPPPRVQSTHPNGKPSRREILRMCRN
jgi:hypothetical protein